MEPKTFTRHRLIVVVTMSNVLSMGLGVVGRLGQSAIVAMELVADFEDVTNLTQFMEDRNV